MNKTNFALAFLAVAALAALPPRAHADSIINVNVNTSAFLNEANSEVIFEFSDGDQSFSSNNTATLTSFNLGGGALGSVDPNSGGPYTGDMSSTLSLQDGTPITAFGQFFTPGSFLSFTVDLTTNPDAGSTPDEFSMFVYDPNGNPLAPVTTDNPFGILLTADITPTGPVQDNYDPNDVTANPAGAPAPVPEPPTLMLAATGLLELLTLSTFRRRRGAAQDNAPTQGGGIAGA